MLIYGFNPTEQPTHHQRRFDMRKMIVVKNPKQIAENHKREQRAKMSDRERQRIEDAEINRDIIEANRKADARLKTDIRRASEGK